MTRGIRNTLGGLLLGAFAVTAPAWAGEAKIPQTVEDHMALAKQYEEKAAGYKKEAAEHREMAEAYKARAPKDKTGRPNPWVVKMEKHCQAIAKNADKLTADSEKAAEYHRLRAGELQGK